MSATGGRSPSADDRTIARRARRDTRTAFPHTLRCSYPTQCGPGERQTASPGRRPTLRARAAHANAVETRPERRAGTRTQHPLHTPGGMCPVTTTRSRATRASVNTLCTGAFLHAGSSEHRQRRYQQTRRAWTGALSLCVSRCWRSLSLTLSHASCTRAAAPPSTKLLMFPT